MPEALPLRNVLPNGATKVARFDQNIEKTGENYSVHVRQILEKESTEIKFLVPGCIPRGNIVLLAGESGAKKSWLAYDLAGAVSSGTGWLGKKMPCPDGPLPVMVLNYDNPTETLRTRFKKLGFTPDHNCYVHTLGYTKPWIANQPELLTLPDQDSRLQLLLEYRKPAFILFDSFRQGVTMDENDSQKMASLMAIFKRWTAINNTTVMVIHHTTKSEKTGGWNAEARGSGEILASSDVVLKASPKQVRTEGTLEWTKSRTWDVGPTTKVDFDVVDKFDDGKPIEDDGLDEDSLKEIELVQRVLVRAKTPLPFEREMKAVERIMIELEKSKDRPFVSFKDMKTRLAGAKDIVKDEVALKAALLHARVLGRAKFVSGSSGRGYRVKDA